MSFTKITECMNRKFQAAKCMSGVHALSVHAKHAHTVKQAGPIQLNCDLWVRAIRHGATSLHAFRR